MLSEGDKFKVQQFIGVPGIEKGVEYRVKRVELVKSRAKYVLESLDSGGTVKVLINDIDSFLGSGDRITVY